MDTLHSWFLARTTAQVRLMTALALVSVLAGGFVAHLTNLDAFTPWVGGVAGIALYGAAYVWVTRDASEDLRDRLDLKGRVVLVQRRAGVVLFGLLWSSLLIYLANLLPGFTRIGLGTLQIVVVGALVNVFRATEVERELIEQAHQDMIDEANRAEEPDEDLPVEQFPQEGAIVDPGPDFPQGGALPPQQPHQ